MSIEVKVPQLPESVADATLVAWHKSAGDKVERDENLADLETDKVVLEVPAPVSGVLKRIEVGDGTTVTSGELLAVIEEGEAAEGARGEPPAAKAEKKSEARKEKKADKGSAEAAEAEGERQQAEQDDEPRERRGAAARKLSPSVRHMLDKHDIEPAEIEGSGKGGRITKSDVVSYLDAGEGRKHDRQVEARSQAPGRARPEPARGSRGERRVAMTRLRARIAERMVQSQQTAALLTSFNEVDLHEVVALRNRYKERFEHEFNARLGFMSFFVKAAVEALKKFPVVNASVDGSDIVYHEYYDIGIAVSTDRGLIVPVVREADRKSFAEIEQQITDYANKAREGTISIDDLTGGTFTITNGGVFGSLMSTPIVNPPQSAILGMHKIQDRPMVIEGGIKIRPMMYIALTYDHRIIDGREAVQFLVQIKERLEDPARLLLQM